MKCLTQTNGETYKLAISPFDLLRNSRDLAMLKMNGYRSFYCTWVFVFACIFMDMYMSHAHDIDPESEQTHLYSVRVQCASVEFAEFQNAHIRFYVRSSIFTRAIDGSSERGLALWGCIQKKEKLLLKRLMYMRKRDTKEVCASPNLSRL